MFQATKAHFFQTNHSRLLSFVSCLFPESVPLFTRMRDVVLQVATRHSCWILVPFGITTDSNDWKTLSTMYKLKVVTQVV